MTHAWTLWTRSLLGASIGLSALVWTSTGLGQLPEVPAAPAVPAVPAVDPAPVVEPAKAAAKDVTDTAKDAVKDAKDTAKDATQPVPGAVRDTARDAREGARDTARDARDTVRDTREGVRDTVRDARDAAGDTIRGVRDTVRDARGSVNASANARANLRWQDLRSADLGLWFNGNANANVSDGLVIADVATQGPIAKLGFQEGDRIVSVNGQRIARQADFMQYLFSSNVADGRVAVIVNRGGKQQTIYMEPQIFLTHVNSYESDRLEQIGIVADDRVQDRVLVWRVTPRSPAYFAGLRAGDVIVSFNKQPVSTFAELSQFAAKADAGPIALEVQRGEKARMLEVDFQAPNAEVRSALRPDLDNGDAPALESSIRTPAASGYYNSNRTYNSGRRGLFRWRR
ncbi:MAG: PDZ domain-containing protein [Pirellulaceae bacterium]